MNLTDIILQKVDIVDYISEHTELKRISRGYQGKCPLHNGDGNNTIWVLDDTQTYYCFSCNSYGNVINFRCELENLNFFECVEQFANELNINFFENKEYMDQKDLVKKYENMNRKYRSKVENIQEHLIKKRALTPETIEVFQLGYEDGSLTIPLIDIMGRVIGFAKRHFREGIAKYTNSKNNILYEKSKFLFNLNRAIRKAKKSIYIVEGYLDAMSADQQELACVAYCSADLSKEHILLLKDVLQKDITIYLAPDNDDVGKPKIPKFRDRFKKYYPKANVRVVVIPEQYKDFNDLLVAGIEIASLPTEHIDIYCLKQLLDNCKDKETEYKVAEEYITDVKENLIKSDIAKLLSMRWDKPLEEIKEWMNVSSNKMVEEILKEFASPSDCLKDYFERAKIDGQPIGFPMIDKAFGGIRKKEVVLIGAFSKVGKSSFMSEIILHSIVRLKQNCLVFSMEMAKEAFMEVLLTKLLGITRYELQQMARSEEKLKIIEEVKEKIGKYLVIIDTNNLSINDIKERVKIANLYHFDKPVDRVFVDYFQYMQNTDTIEQISKTAMSMKPFCKELNVELYMLSQFNRENSPWTQPSIKSFKGGNAMESSFDKSILLWRPGLNPELTGLQKEDLKYITMIKLISRDGIIGEDIYELEFDPKTSRIREKNIDKHE